MLSLSRNVSLVGSRVLRAMSSKPGKTKEEILRDKTPKGKLDAEFEHGIKKAKQVETYTDPYLPRHPNGVNEKTGEVGGPAGPEPTRFGDWERKGRVTDF